MSSSPSGSVQHDISSSSLFPAAQDPQVGLEVESVAKPERSYTSGSPAQLQGQTAANSCLPRVQLDL